MDEPDALLPAATRAVLFDAYGTPFDVYSVGLLAEQVFPGQGQALKARGIVTGILSTATP